MIRFQIVPWRGTFVGGQFEIDANHDGVPLLVEQLTTDFDMRQDAAIGYVPGMDSLAMETLRGWNAEIIERTMPQDNQNIVY